MFHGMKLQERSTGCSLLPALVDALPECPIPICVSVARWWRPAMQVMSTDVLIFDLSRWSAASKLFLTMSPDQDKLYWCRESAATALNTRFLS